MVIVMNKIFSNHLNAESINFKYARGISDKNGREFHTYYEIILFLGGEAELITENIHSFVKPKSLIIIPKETYHQLLIRGNQNEYFRCVLNFFDIYKLDNLISSVMKDCKIIETDSKIDFLFDCLINSNQNENSGVILYSVLVLLLNHLESSQGKIAAKTAINNLIGKAVTYINDNIERNIKVSEIARFLCVSVSTIQHTFKKEMNISVHQYILKKKLISAYHLINSGTPATFVARRLGFEDYSGFFKQYKKMFGVSPSKSLKDENFTL